MKSFCFLGLGLVLLSPFVSAGRYELRAVDSVTISRDRNFAFYWSTYPYVLASNSPLSTYKRCEGALKFDLSKIPDNAKITSIYLVSHHALTPKERPIIELYWSDDDNWTRKTAKGGSCPPKTLLYRTGEVPGRLGSFILPMDSSRHDFSADLKDNVLTLVLRCAKFVPKKECGVCLGDHKGGGPPTLVICTGSGHIQTFGRGGVDSTGTRLRLCATGCPAAGSRVTFRVECGLDLKAPGVLFFGVSRSSWGGITLPLDLASLGAPGNFLYTGLEVGPLAVPNGGGGGSLVVPIPSGSLTGRFFAQALLFDSKANRLQCVFSNGLDLGIG